MIWVKIHKLFQERQMTEAVEKILENTSILNSRNSGQDQQRILHQWAADKYLAQLAIRYNNSDLVNDLQSGTVRMEHN